MPIIRFFMAALSVLRPILLALVPLFTFVELCAAQSTTPLVAPAPLGTPGVPVGPPLDPFGPRPMPIAPAPYPYIQYPYVQSWAFPPAYSLPYSTTPYLTRRPTSFDVAGQARGLPYDGVDQSQFPPPGYSNQGYSVQRAGFQVAEVPKIGNFRLTLTENFLNRLISREETKPGEVHDFILGAIVTGQQTTVTKLRFDLRPSPDKIHGVIVLNGTTDTQTTGVTRQAMVDVAGQQQFVAVKDVFFDGMNLTTRHAVVHVQARNQTLGARTPLSGTLLGGIADRIAYRVAERSQPAAEAIARDRVADRVYPEFDTEIDKQLATANDQLSGSIRPMLRTMNLFPTRQQASSTESTLNYSAQIGAEAPATMTTPPENQADKIETAHLLIYESLLNTLIGRSGLKGLKTTDQQIKEFMKPYALSPTEDDPKETEPPIAIPGMANVVTDIVFDETDPMTIKVDNDRTFMKIRASFKPAGQDVLPQLAITIDYKTEIKGTMIVMTPGNVRVDTAKLDDSNSTSSIASNLVSKMIESSLTKLGVERSLPAKQWPFSGPVPQVTNIRMQDGWAAISID